MLLRPISSHDYSLSLVLLVCFAPSFPVHPCTHIWDLTGATQKPCFCLAMWLTTNTGYTVGCGRWLRLMLPQLLFIA